MTWVWFFFLGVLALAFRKPIANGMTGQSNESLKGLAWVGLLFFSFMALFGSGIDFWLLHIAAAIAGIIGFFAVSENMRRSGIRRSQKRLQSMREQLREREAPRRASPRPRRSSQPPLITPRDSPAHVVELLSRAAEEWEAQEPAPPAPPITSQIEPVAKAVGETEPVRAADIPTELAQARKRLIEIIAHDDEQPVEDVPQVAPVQSEPERVMPRPVRQFQVNLQVDSKLGQQESAPVPTPVRTSVTPSPVLDASKPAPAVAATERMAGPVSLGLATGPRATSPVQLGASSARFGGSGPISLGKGTGYKPQVKSRLGRHPADDDGEQQVETGEPAAS